MIMKGDDDYDKVDLDALRRAMKMAAREPGRADQLAVMLEARPWHEVAKFAAYCCQTSALRLQPWEEAPCHAVILAPDGRGGMREVRDPNAGALMDRLREAGLSKWEPDPVEALAKVKGRRK